MERDRETSVGGQSEPEREGDTPDPRTLAILQRYSSGDISARQAAKEMGARAAEHDVFAGIIAARLPLPEPPADVVAREVAALRALYGPHGPPARA